MLLLFLGLSWKCVGQYKYSNGINNSLGHTTVTASQQSQATSAYQNCMNSGGGGAACQAAYDAALSGTTSKTGSGGVCAGKPVGSFCTTASGRAGTCDNNENETYDCYATPGVIQAGGDCTNNPNACASNLVCTPTGNGVSSVCAQPGI